MALALYQVLTPYPLTINSNDLSGQYPATFVVQPKGVFVGNTTDPLLVSLFNAGALASAGAGNVTPNRFETFTQTP